MESAGTKPSAGPPRARALKLLRIPKLWLFPVTLTGLVALLLSLVYMGGIVNPERHLTNLPIAVVNEDTGEPLAGRPRNAGDQIVRSLMSGAGQDRAEWLPVSREQAQDQLASGKVYGALIIPEGFTESIKSLDGTAGVPQRPTLTVLTNPASGGLGSTFATNIATGAAEQASRTIGEQLAQAPAHSATASLLLADPIEIDTEEGHPVGDNSGLGLSAFYYTLLLILAALLGANLISSAVDAALGYADSEIGPWHRRLATVPIDRTQTLWVKMAMTAVITAVSVSLIMLACVSILDMDAGHLPLLWLYSYFASLAVALGTQAINAAFGGIGQLVSMFAFIVLGLPSSGAAVPLQAVPDIYRFLSAIEPMRHLVDGARAILYFDARADAGLARAWIMIALGLALALLFGFATTVYYDRKGCRRLSLQPAK
ncbi:DUF3533 domain-containing protein [Streptomyces sp. NPDC092307]|uniref:YhgE/Pip domain-containing protein n=1 Tax=Streptomyces sp. NPDC092307 TaxID=3366013 RepID=UPI0037FEFC97